jgi:hypothetical protein
MEATMTEYDLKTPNLPEAIQPARALEGGAVGYCQPPVRSRFKPGHSGNPKGRPKQPRNLWGEAKEVYMGTIAVREGDKKTQVTRITALVRMLLDKGLQGDTRAALSALKIAIDLGVMAEFKTDKKKNSCRYTPEEAATLSDGALEELLVIEEKRNSQNG